MSSKRIRHRLPTRSRSAHNCSQARTRRLASVGLFVAATALAVSAATAGCGDNQTSADDVDSTPQLLAIADKCDEIACGDHPLYFSDATDEDFRAQLEGWSPNVHYLSDEEQRSLTNSNLRFTDGGYLMEVTRVNHLSDVLVGVDVALYEGYGSVHITTYLYEYRGSQWHRVEPETVDVTVTSSVS